MSAIYEQMLQERRNQYARENQSKSDIKRQKLAVKGAEKAQRLGIQGNILMNFSGADNYDADSVYVKGRIDNPKGTTRMGYLEDSLDSYYNAPEKPSTIEWREHRQATPEEVADYRASMIVADNYAMGAQASTPEEIQSLRDAPLTDSQWKQYKDGMQAGYDYYGDNLEFRGEEGNVGIKGRQLGQVYNPELGVESQQDRMLATGVGSMYSNGQPITNETIAQGYDKYKNFLVSGDEEDTSDDANEEWGTHRLKSLGRMLTAIPEKLAKHTADSVIDIAGRVVNDTAKLVDKDSKVGTDWDMGTSDGITKEINKDYNVDTKWSDKNMKELSTVFDTAMAGDVKKGVAQQALEAIASIASEEGYGKVADGLNAYSDTAGEAGEYIAGKLEDLATATKDVPVVNLLTGVMSGMMNTYQHMSATDVMKMVKIGLRNPETAIESGEFFLSMALGSKGVGAFSKINRVVSKIERGGASKKILRQKQPEGMSDKKWKKKIAQDVVTEKRRKINRVYSSMNKTDRAKAYIARDSGNMVAAVNTANASLDDYEKVNGEKVGYANAMVHLAFTKALINWEGATAKGNVEAAYKYAGDMVDLAKGTNKTTMDLIKKTGAKMAVAPLGMIKAGTHEAGQEYVQEGYDATGKYDVTKLKGKELDKASKDAVKSGTIGAVVAPGMAAHMQGVGAVAGVASKVLSKSASKTKDIIKKKQEEKKAKQEKEDKGVDTASTDTQVDVSTSLDEVVSRLEESSKTNDYTSMVKDVKLGNEFMKGNASEEAKKKFEDTRLRVVNQMREVRNKVDAEKKGEGTTELGATGSDKKQMLNAQIATYAYDMDEVNEIEDEDKKKEELARLATERASIQQSILESKGELGMNNEEFDEYVKDIKDMGKGDIEYASLIHKKFKLDKMKKGQGDVLTGEGTIEGKQKLAEAEAEYTRDVENYATKGYKDWNTWDKAKKAHTGVITGMNKKLGYTTWGKHTVDERLVIVDNAVKLLDEAIELESTGADNKKLVAIKEELGLPKNSKIGSHTLAMPGVKEKEVSIKGYLAAMKTQLETKKADGQLDAKVKIDANPFNKAMKEQSKLTNDKMSKALKVQKKGNVKSAKIDSQKKEYVKVREEELKVQKKQIDNDVKYKNKSEEEIKVDEDANKEEYKQFKNITGVSFKDTHNAKVKQESTVKSTIGKHMIVRYKKIKAKGTMFKGVKVLENIHKLMTTPFSVDKDGKSKLAKVLGEAITEKKAYASKLSDKKVDEKAKIAKEIKEIEQMVKDVNKGVGLASEYKKQTKHNKLDAVVYDYKDNVGRVDKQIEYNEKRIAMLDEQLSKMSEKTGNADVDMAVDNDRQEKLEAVKAHKEDLASKKQGRVDSENKFNEYVEHVKTETDVKGLRYNSNKDTVSEVVSRTIKVVNDAKEAYGKVYEGTKKELVAGGGLNEEQVKVLDEYVKKGGEITSEVKRVYNDVLEWISTSPLEGRVDRYKMRNALTDSVAVMSIESVDTDKVVSEIEGRLTGAGSNKEKLNKSITAVKNVAYNEMKDTFGVNGLRQKYYKANKVISEIAENVINNTGLEEAKEAQMEYNKLTVKVELKNEEKNELVDRIESMQGMDDKVDEVTELQEQLNDMMDEIDKMKDEARVHRDSVDKILTSGYRDKSAIEENVIGSSVLTEAQNEQLEVMDAEDVFVIADKRSKSMGVDLTKAGEGVVVNENGDTQMVTWLKDMASKLANKMVQTDKSGKQVFQNSVDREGDIVGAKRDYSLQLLLSKDEDGVVVVDPNVMLAIKTVLADFTQGQLQGLISNSDEQIEKMWKDATAEQKKILKHSTFLKNVVPGLGKALMKEMGVKVQISDKMITDSKVDNADKLTRLENHVHMSMGYRVLQQAMLEGIIEENRLDTKDPSKSTGYVKLVNGSKVQTAVVRIKGKDAKEITKTAENATNDPLNVMVSQLFGRGDEAKMEQSYTRIKMATTENTKVYNSKLGIDVSNEVVNSKTAYEQTQYEENTEVMEDLLEIFAEGGEMRDAALAELGYVSDEMIDSGKMEPGLREDAISKNTQILKEIADMQEHMDKRAEGLAGKYMWFKTKVIKNIRNMIVSNKLNPLISKLHRFAVTPASFKQDIDMGDDGTANAIYVGIAQAYGIAIDKLQPIESVAYGKLIYEKGSKYVDKLTSELVMGKDGMAKELQKEASKVLVQDMKDRVNGMSDKYVAHVMKKRGLKGGKKELISAMGLDSGYEAPMVEIEEMAHMLQAKHAIRKLDAGNGKAKDVVLSMEYDGQQNGVSSKAMQFMVNMSITNEGKSDTVERWSIVNGELTVKFSEDGKEHVEKVKSKMVATGMYVDEGIEIENGLAYNLDIGQKDTYSMDADKMKANTDGIRNVKARKWMNGSMLEAMKKFAGGTDAELRKLIKYVLMPNQYGAMLRSAAKKIGVDTMGEKMSQGMWDIANTDAEGLVDAVEKSEIGEMYKKTVFAWVNRDSKGTYKEVDVDGMREFNTELRKQIDDKGAIRYVTMVDMGIDKSSLLGISKYGKKETGAVSNKIGIISYWETLMGDLYSDSTAEILSGASQHTVDANRRITNAFKVATELMLETDKQVIAKAQEMLSEDEKTMTVKGKEDLLSRVHRLIAPYAKIGETKTEIVNDENVDLEDNSVGVVLNKNDIGTGKITVRAIEKVISKAGQAGAALSIQLIDAVTQARLVLRMTEGVDEKDKQGMINIFDAVVTAVANASKNSQMSNEIFADIHLENDAAHNALKMVRDAIKRADKEAIANVDKKMAAEYEDVHEAVKHKDTEDRKEYMFDTPDNKVMTVKDVLEELTDYTKENAIVKHGVLFGEDGKGERIYSNQFAGAMANSTVAIEGNKIVAAKKRLVDIVEEITRGEYNYDELVNDEAELANVVNKKKLYEVRTTKKRDVVKKIVNELFNDVGNDELLMDMFQHVEGADARGLVKKRKEYVVDYISGLDGEFDGDKMMMDMAKEESIKAKQESTSSKQNGKYREAINTMYDIIHEKMSEQDSSNELEKEAVKLDC